MTAASPGVVLGAALWTWAHHTTSDAGGTVHLTGSADGNPPFCRSRTPLPVALETSLSPAAWGNQHLQSGLLHLQDVHEQGSLLISNNALQTLPEKSLEIKGILEQVT